MYNKTTKSLLFISLFFFLLNFLLGSILIYQSSTSLISIINQRMLDISNTAADMLNGDILEKLTAKDYETEEYKSVINTLRHFQNKIDLKYIYCIKNMGNKQFTFSVDPTIDDPGEFGSPIVYTDALYQASLGTPAVDTKPYTDKWGTFYSAYSPVFNSSGKVAGIVAVDFSAKWYDTQINNSILVTVIISLTSLLVGGIIVLLFSNIRRKRFISIYNQLNLLAESIERLIFEIDNLRYSKKENEKRVSNRVKKSMPNDADIDAIKDAITLMEANLHDKIKLVHQAAYIDSMTTVLNKSAYLDTIKKIDENIGNNIAEFSVAVFDINGLKSVNDNYGHEIGDLLIIDTANALLKIFDKKSIYRIGGDEFIAILYDEKCNTIDKLLEDLDNEITLENQHKKPYNISISKGYAKYDKNLYTSYKDVFKEADKNMYADKAAFYKTHGDRRKI